MNKSELVSHIAERSGESKVKTSMILEMFAETITDILKEGGQVVLPGFGTWSVTTRPERDGRNPQTGAPIKIKESRVAKFKAGKSLKEAVQGA